VIVSLLLLRDAVWCVVESPQRVVDGSLERSVLELTVLVASACLVPVNAEYEPRVGCGRGGAGSAMIGSRCQALRRRYYRTA